MKIKMKDWQIRALKTFAQAFGGVAIPEVVVLLQNGVLLQGWSRFWIALTPFLCSALAAGISAAWNIIAEWLKNQEETDNEL